MFNVREIVSEVHPSSYHLSTIGKKILTKYSLVPFPFLSYDKCSLKLFYPKFDPFKELVYFEQKSKDNFFLNKTFFKKVLLTPTRERDII